MKMRRTETNTMDYYTIKGKRNNQHFTFNIKCEYEKTRSGFRHLCWIDYSTLEGEEASSYNKCCYLNRTWECYTFESAILGAMEKLRIGKNKKDKAEFIRKVNNYIRENRNRCKREYLY